MGKFRAVIVMASVIGLAHNTPISFRPRVNKSIEDLNKNHGSDKEQENRWLQAENKRKRKNQSRLHTSRC